MAQEYSVYSEGFRGLPARWFQISRCNFLVGENSTGKSSLLQLLRLFQSQAHTIFFDLCGAIEDLGTAHDVCSRITNSKRVTVGYLNCTSDDAEDSDEVDEYGRIATYKKKNETMELERLTLLSHDHVLRMRHRGGRLWHRIDKLRENEAGNHQLKRSALIDYHQRKGDRFTKFEEGGINERDKYLWAMLVSRQTFKAEGNKSIGFWHPSSPLGDLHHHGPIRAKPRRLYHGSKVEFSPTGEHVPFLIRDAQQDKNPKLKESITKFGKKSGLFDRISVTSVKTAINDKPFALQIEKSGSVFYVDELGFGVGQVLPLIADIALNPHSNTFLIQQPELHLHPKAQAEFGEVVQAASDDGRTFVIETHSDFLIDRYRMKRGASEQSNDAQIIYFEKSTEGSNIAHSIKIKSDGSLDQTPDGYRQFFLNESVEKFEKL